MKRLVLLLAVAVVAGCGGSSKPQTSSTTTVPAVQDPAAAMKSLIARNPALAGKVKTLYQGTLWAVVQVTGGKQATAVAFHLVGDTWVPDQSGVVKLDILGPQPGATTTSRKPQVAIQFTAKTPFVETALWVDGTELLEKGGGSPTRGAIYGAPAHPLKAGEHVAVGYARTIATGTAKAWVFTVG